MSTINKTVAFVTPEVHDLTKTVKNLLLFKKSFVIAMDLDIHVFFYSDVLTKNANRKGNLYLIYQRCLTISPLATCGEWLLKCGEWLCYLIFPNLDVLNCMKV